MLQTEKKDSKRFHYNVSNQKHTKIGKIQINCNQSTKKGDSEYVC